MRILIFGCILSIIFISGCGIKQIRENSEATRAQTEELLQKQAIADSTRDAQIAELKQRLETQDALIRGFNATLSGRLDGIDQNISRMAIHLQDATGRFTDVAMGMHEMQKKVLGDTVNTDTVSAKTALNTADTDLSRGHFELASAGYSTFIERWGNSPMAGAAYFGRGQAKLALNDTAGAIADFRVAGTEKQTVSSTPTALWQLGKLFLATGNAVGARESWNQIVKNFPDTPEAARAKEQLDKLKAEPKKGKRR